MAERTVLVVDPDEEDRRETAEAFRTAAVEANIVAADSRSQAVDVLVETAVDTVVTRYHLGDGTGLELVATVREQYPEIDCFLYAETTAIDTESFEATVVEFVPRDRPDASETLVSLVTQEPEVGQANYPVPSDEERRLAALDRYGTLSEQTTTALTDLCSLGRQQFDASTVVVALVDEHSQHVVASEGPLDPPSERATSLSTHTLVSEDGSMAVDDLQADQRFVEEEQLQAADFGAYLGAPVTTPEGHPVGVVSIYGSHPREFTASDRAYVETLAELAADVLLLGTAGATGRGVSE